MLEHNPFINMKVGFSDYDETNYRDSIVKLRAVDNNGKPLGVPNIHPALDTRKYHVKYADGTSEILSANIIAENVMANVDKEGHCQMLIDLIVDHQSTKEAIPKSQGLIRPLMG